MNCVLRSAVHHLEADRLLVGRRPAGVNPARGGGALGSPRHCAPILEHAHVSTSSTCTAACAASCALCFLGFAAILRSHVPHILCNHGRHRLTRNHGHPPRLIIRLRAAVRVEPDRACTLAAQVCLPTLFGGSADLTFGINWAGDNGGSLSWGAGDGDESSTCLYGLWNNVRCLPLCVCSQIIASDQF